ncbi:SCO1664 family protein [Kallotenue papyrolyticum]|uniref:SCO1664 family protein n=1 Tax=Kallotenue papyrolyticum TaxID=1325125 RepID=UPI0004928F26|nr:SCO1664 family protein [Kallotenue papyrolyticum]
MDDQHADSRQDQLVGVDHERLLRWLAQGQLDVLGLMPDSSNYTFLVEIDDGELHGLAVYKPRRGERPLWDFPRGTLCQREVAAYLVSEALGWQIVPPTVLRDAHPYGVGSVQLFIDADPDAHYFTLRGSDHAAFKRIAAFDLVTNNADRKGGHILKDRQGRLWGIDHGITFHVEPKLRTVIWDYAGQPVPDTLLDDVRTLAERLERADDMLSMRLRELLDRAEIDALRRRIERLLRRPRYPEPGSGRSVPWPPI